MANHQLRMGRTMSYTGQDGVEHPSSFWYLHLFATDIDQMTARLVFIAHHDAASYDAERAPIAGALKEYLVTPALWQQTTGMAIPPGAPNIGAAILAMAWQVALATKDQLDTETSTEGTPVARSFFADSQPVESSTAPPEPADAPTPTDTPPAEN